jgi:transcriptional regulator with XRE-family HTH domain
MSPRRRTPSAELVIRYRRVLVPVGAAIAARRKELGLTQREVAKACGIERASIAALEAGTRNATLITLARIAEALGCTVADLMRDAGV